MHAIVYHAEAQRELIQSACFYEEQEAGLGDRFLYEFNQVVLDVSENPLAWPLLHDVYRRCQFRHFPYGVIYSLDADTIRVFAIMHLQKMPNTWLVRTLSFSREKENINLPMESL